MRVILSLLIVILILSCESVVDFEFESQTDQLVVNSLSTLDSLMVVNLTESRDMYVIQDNSCACVKGASITLYQDGIAIDTLLYVNEGNYISTAPLDAVESEYEIRISTLEYEVASAVNYIPVLVSVDSFEFYENQGITEYNDKYHQMILYFTDPDSIANYYEIAIHYEYLDSIRFLGYPSSLYTLFSPDPVINSEIDTRSPGFWSVFSIFSDDLINGLAYGLRINFHNYIQSSRKYKFRVTVYLNSVSRDYYLYRKKLLLYGRSTTVSPWEDIVEPVMIYSNIVGGYGIFAGYQTDTLSFIVN